MQKKLVIESLEQRQMLAQTPQLLGDIYEFSPAEVGQLGTRESLIYYSDRGPALSDGTVGGTFNVGRPQNPGHAGIWDFTVFDGDLYFYQTEHLDNSIDVPVPVLHRSDGTRGDFERIGERSHNQEFPFVLNDDLIICCNDEFKQQIGFGQGSISRSVAGKDFVAFGGSSFTDDDQSYGLWITDGTPAGTHQVVNLNGRVWPIGITNSGGIYFWHDEQIWWTDRSGEDARPVFAGATCNCDDGRVWGDNLLLTWNHSAPRGSELLLIKQGYVVQVVLKSAPRQLPDRLIYESDDVIAFFDVLNQRAILVTNTDGSAAGFEINLDGLPRPQSAISPDMFAVGDYFYLRNVRDIFRFRKDGSGLQQARSGGAFWFTEELGVIVNDVHLGLSDGRMIFSAVDDRTSKLWITDGTEVGTEVLADYPPAPTFTAFWEVGDRIVFRSENKLYGIDTPLTLEQLTKIDLNLDGQINMADFLILSGNFGSKNADETDGDFNDDNVVDFLDFLLLSNAFGATI